MIQGEMLPMVTLRQLAVLQAWRCSHCNKMLCKLDLMPGSTVELKCPRCEAINTLHLTSLSR